MMCFKANAARQYASNNACTYENSKNNNRKETAQNKTR